MSRVMEDRAITALAELGLVTARLHLDSVSQQAAAEEWTYTHFLGHLLDGELKEKRRRAVELKTRRRTQLAVRPLSISETY